ncbi:ABC transporter G family member 23 [Liparis tanakae]|uniref:ABC transporter G family member 23 n=1 Tax=Liparis tanakae TaxID=230148 RepID=A0A4Z2FHM0_9TELE|nr:ABC transporter G family member 23 [Liparis tanakae]
MTVDLEASPPAAPEAFAILCRDVCRSYGKAKVLSSLTLSVPQGHIYGLLGPSGCGKTTLLKCIVGTLKISRGHICVLGKPPAYPGHDVPGRMVGYMPQCPRLFSGQCPTAVLRSVPRELLSGQCHRAVLSITFFLAVGLTALSFVLERKEGLLDRCWVAGVSSLETMLAHLFSQLFVISVQIVLLLLFVLLVFKDDVITWTCLPVATPPGGSSRRVIWPVECIPYPLRYVSVALPQTYASEALRCIMYRGWGLSQMMVWRGFAVTLGWNTFFLVLATVIMKLRT